MPFASTLPLSGLAPPPSAPTRTPTMSQPTPAPRTQPAPVPGTSATPGAQGPVSDPNVPYQGRDGTATTVPQSTLYAEAPQIEIAAPGVGAKPNLPFILIGIGLLILLLRGTFK